MVTVPGGQTINTPGLTPQQEQQLGDAMANLAGQGFTSSNIITDPNAPPSTVPGVLNIYNLPAGSLPNHTYAMKPGAQVLIVLGTDPVTITGTPGADLIVGNNADDTIKSGGMGGSIIGGNANNVIDASSSNQDPSITTGTGNDTVTIGSGTNTVTALGNLTLKGGGGDDTVNVEGTKKSLLQQASGHIDIDVTGNNNTINIKNGKDTIDVTGRGTKINSSIKSGLVVNESGPVSMVFKGAGNDTITLGDGSNTISDSGPVSILGGGPSGNGHNRIDLTGSTRADIRTDGHNTILFGAARNSRSNPTVNATIGGGGNDTIIATSKVNLTTTGEPGNIDFTGIGNDSLTLNGGGNLGNEVTVDSEKARITLRGGASNLDVTEKSAKITEDPNAGGTNITAQGNDTINLGTGNDTITDKGGATLFGGGGSFSFTGGAGGRDQVVVGSGNATLSGGGGVNVFHAGSGSTSMTGGAGSKDTFVGGSGFDTMDAQGAKSAVFQFSASNHGGTHTIDHFQSGPDKLQLSGYDTATVLANAQVIGGNTVLSLGDGTTITLQGFTHLTASDFK
jgi:Ca2+-binding RTX toxin-like protein